MRSNAKQHAKQTNYKNKKLTAHMHTNNTHYGDTMRKQFSLYAE